MTDLFTLGRAFARDRSDPDPPKVCRGGSFGRRALGPKAPSSPRLRWNGRRRGRKSSRHERSSAFRFGPFGEISRRRGSAGIPSARSREDRRVGNETVGHVGRIHPDAARLTDVDESVVMFELDLGALERLRAKVPRFRSLEKFPGSRRDVSFLVPDELPAGDVLDAVAAVGGKSVEHVEVFDEYKGEGVPDGFRALAFALTYRAADRTLTEEEVVAAHSAIVEKLLDRLPIKQR